MPKRDLPVWWCEVLADATWRGNNKKVKGLYNAFTTHKGAMLRAIAKGDSDSAAVSATLAFRQVNRIAGHPLAARWHAA